MYHIGYVITKELNIKIRTKVTQGKPKWKTHLELEMEKKTTTAHGFEEFADLKLGT